MNIVLFYHSLLSDWNHGNAHFLRGVATELISRGNAVKVYERENNWSLTNLVKDHGEEALANFHSYYPLLTSTLYNPAAIDWDEVLADADMVIVHEWNEHALVKAIGEAKKRHDFKLLFHDTHHRAITGRQSMKQYDLSKYDGVLAFGNVIKDIYLKERWTKNAWTWHEAADTHVFYPKRKRTPGCENGENDYDGDFVWIGNWGDEERTKELYEFIIEPVKALKLRAKIYGVRYPAHAQKALKDAGIAYGGWLPNYKAPEVFSRYRFTVHVPRQPYVKSLPGIPTIRPFEAMACGIPLLCAPWNDAEHLFTAGKDYVQVANKKEMMSQMERVLTDACFAAQLSSHALKTIQRQHTCAHRVDELYEICADIGVKNLKKQNTLT